MPSLALFRSVRCGRPPREPRAPLGQPATPHALARALLAAQGTQCACSAATACSRPAGWRDGGLDQAEGHQCCRSRDRQTDRQTATERVRAGCLFATDRTDGLRQALAHRYGTKAGLARSNGLLSSEITSSSANKKSGLGLLASIVSPRTTFDQRISLRSSSYMSAGARNARQCACRRRTCYLCAPA